MRPRSAFMLFDDDTHETVKKEMSDLYACVVLCSPLRRDTSRYLKDKRLRVRSETDTNAPKRPLSACMSSRSELREIRTPVRSSRK